MEKYNLAANQRLPLGEMEIDSKEKKIIPDMVSQMLFPAE